MRDLRQISLKLIYIEEGADAPEVTIKRLKPHSQFDCHFMLSRTQQLSNISFISIHQPLGISGPLKSLGNNNINSNHVLKTTSVV